jgi:hypothetical protein
MARRRFISWAGEKRDGRRACGTAVWRRNVVIEAFWLWQFGWGYDRSKSTASQARNLWFIVFFSSLLLLLLENLVFVSQLVASFV